MKSKDVTITVKGPGPIRDLEGVAMNEQIKGWCVMCGAAPGKPCTVISASPDDDLKPGDVRPAPHFYRDGALKRRPGVLVKDEPGFDGTPPIDNEHVASGCQLFTDEEIALNVRRNKPYPWAGHCNGCGGCTECKPL